MRNVKCSGVTPPSFLLIPALFSDTSLLFLESDRSSGLRLFLVDCTVDRQVEPLHW